MRVQDPPYLQKTDRRNKSEQADTDHLQNYLRTQVSRSDSPKNSDLAFLSEFPFSRTTSSRREDEFPPPAFREARDSKFSLSTHNRNRSRTRDSHTTEAPGKSPPIPAEGQVRSIDPPRPAREGHEWVWFPQGYWAERKVQERQEVSRPHIWRSRSSKDQLKTSNRLSSLDNNRPDKSPDLENCSIFSWPATSSRGLPSPEPHNDPQDSNDNVQRTSAAQKIRKGLHYFAPASPHSNTQNTLSEGLYNKTKRGLESLSKRKKTGINISTISQSAQILPSQTTTTIEGTTSYLAQMNRESDRRQMLHQNDSQSSDSRTPRKLFGLAPWHRQNSYDTTWSVSSSIRELLSGKTPASTPRSESPIEIHKAKASSKAESKAKSHVEQLPTEARRVNTPPLSSAFVGGRSRGFFFDLTPPHEDSDPDQRRSGKDNIQHVEAQETPRLIQNRLPSTGKRKREWWEVDIPVSARRGEMQPPNFTLDIPEHLPNSPLCPMNPKHKSGGTGICVYHGRKLTRESSSDELKLE